MTQPAHKCCVGRNAQGHITVDGVAYPMAESVVATESEIQEKIRLTAKRIAEDYKTATHRDTFFNTNTQHQDKEVPISMENPLIIFSILKGSYIFTADLVRYLNDFNLPHVVDFYRCSSYNNGVKTTGVVHLFTEPKYQFLKGKEILIVEDVCDSGVTLQYLVNYIIHKYEPKRVKICVLASKPPSARRVPCIRSDNTTNNSNKPCARRTVSSSNGVDYAVLQAPDKYIIGYGFEVNDRYRPFRHIFTLKEGEGKRYPAKL